MLGQHLSVLLARSMDQTRIGSWGWSGHPHSVCPVQPLTRTGPYFAQASTGSGQGPSRVIHKPSRPSQGRSGHIKPPSARISCRAGATTPEEVQVRYLQLQNGPDQTRPDQTSADKRSLQLAPRQTAKYWASSARDDAKRTLHSREEVMQKCVTIVQESNASLVMVIVVVSKSKSPPVELQAGHPPAQQCRRAEREAHRRNAAGSLFSFSPMLCFVSLTHSPKTSPPETSARTGRISHQGCFSAAPLHALGELVRCFGCQELPPDAWFACLRLSSGQCAQLQSDGDQTACVLCDRSFCFSLPHHSHRLCQSQPEDVGGNGTSIDQSRSPARPVALGSALGSVGLRRQPTRQPALQSSDPWIPGLPRLPRSPMPAARMKQGLRERRSILSCLHALAPSAPAMPLRLVHLPPGPCLFLLPIAGGSKGVYHGDRLPHGVREGDQRGWERRKARGDSREQTEAGVDERAAHAAGQGVEDIPTTTDNPPEIGHQGTAKADDQLVQEAVVLVNVVKSEANQPSDEDDDPLNWPLWKKELNFGALLFMVALVSVMKTAFITVNSQLAMGYMVSYTAVAALTGVPLMVSAFTGMLSLITSRIWGKRPVYLVSVLFIFVGAVWCTFTARSYAQCMAARVFQGLGWGAFDTLVLGSIHDTYFVSPATRSKASSPPSLLTSFQEHERGLRVAIYSIVSVSTTWGAPLLGGVASRTPAGFTVQYQVINSFLAVAVPLMALGAPETNYDRIFSMIQTPASAWSLKQLPPRPRGSVSVEAVKEYVKGMKPYSYEGPSLGVNILLQAPRAAVAPTTLMLFLVSFLPLSALWGLSSSLSLLFSPMPFMLSTSSLGALSTAPWLMSTAAVAVFALLPVWHTRFVPKFNFAALAGGAALSFMGILVFGLYVERRMSAPSGGVSAFAPDGVGRSVSFPAVSFALGLLAAGVYVLDATARPMVRRSTQFTSSNVAAALRHTGDMEAGLAAWRALAAGVFVVALPNAVWAWEGLRATAIGVAAAEAGVALAAAGVWWFYDENVRRLDGWVMGCVDLDLLKRSGSFFDMD
ncbi:uncharacterized protein E0L32_007496 [Thyridium curvatum]|uniref:Uncharacterized protein n=1 Tax=Thyridium curvatum TaxID=1093900 RepID=A0A507B383_9PEZI|nr:uncharacterized protein E0L32_007496 [Thyridium curvatum]TPX11759.1 hypothetical protein E0L32_007496 [Thyridium curvatum]